jgi:hypothetical protein
MMRRRRSAGDLTGPLGDQPRTGAEEDVEAKHPRRGEVVSK